MNLENVNIEIVDDNQGKVLTVTKDGKVLLNAILVEDSIKSY